MAGDKQTERPYIRVKMPMGKIINFCIHYEKMLNRTWLVWLEKLQYWDKHKNAPKYEARSTKDIESEKYYNGILAQIIDCNKE